MQETALVYEYFARNGQRKAADYLDKQGVKCLTEQLTPSPEQWIHSATRIIDSEPKPEVKEVRQVKTTVGKCVDCNKSGVDTTKGHKRCVDCHRKYIAAFQPKPKNRGKPEQATAQANMDPW